MPANNWSPKVAAIRADWENRHPEIAAQRAVDHFERSAIALPADLTPTPEMTKWRAREITDAASIYRDLVIADAHGVLLRDAGTDLGRDRRTAALKVLRASSAVIEATENRPARNGRVMPLIVLRARHN